MKEGLTTLQNVRRIDSAKESCRRFSTSALDQNLNIFMHTKPRIGHEENLTANTHYKKTHNKGEQVNSH
jgi:hypothetical protein